VDVSSFDRGHEAVVGALRRLGWGPDDLLSVHLLAGGLSGSSGYRLDLAGEDVVLKVTRPSVSRQVWERAQREFLFYRDLATRVPVVVPRVLGLDLSETEGVVILLAAYARSPSPDEWTEHAYIQVARQLGRFHAAFWDKTATLALPEWLREMPPVTDAQCREAARRWRALGARDDLDDALGASCRRLEHLVMEVPALDQSMTSLPTTLCHGDFHADNLLQGPDGEWIWADWQEVQLGPGVNDLAFFWQRAFVANETLPPYETMVQVYGVGLETVDGAVVSREQLDRALAWAEFRCWLVDWPFYLGALSTTRMERVLRRIETLIDQLEITGHR
jgi:Ser/Thr protein kinase RdoA (MazF antagonist)